MGIPSYADRPIEGKHQAQRVREIVSRRLVAALFRESFAAEMSYPARHLTEHQVISEVAIDEGIRALFAVPGVVGRTKDLVLTDIEKICCQCHNRAIVQAY